MNTGKPYSPTGFELVAEGAVLITAAVFVFFIGGNTKIMSIVVGALIVLRFVFLYRKGDVVYFLVGFVVGGGNDVMSMWRGVYYYTPPTILPVPIPVWMLFFWGLGFLFLRRLVRWRFFQEEDSRREKLFDKPLVADVAVAVVYRAIVYSWAAVAYLPGALYASILVIRVLVFPPSREERRLMISILLLGPLYEALLIGGGLYVYQNGAVFGMPIWLVVYWVFMIRVMKQVFDWLETKIAAKKLP